jgi:hypothetical protein
MTPHLLFPDFRDWMADPPTMLPAAQRWQENLASRSD